MLISQKKILIAVLTYNCVSKLESLKKSLSCIENDVYENYQIDIMIFDDCSNALTQKKLRTLFEPEKLLFSGHNLGYGGNVKRAFMHAEENSFDIISIFPGDMQRNFEDLIKMIDICIQEDFDVVIGAKDKNKIYGKMPL